jgi:hypothetical protein
MIEISKIKNKSIMLIIDDTISKKAKPRTKALNYMDYCSYHHSHTENKRVYGHQIVVAILKCGKFTLPYDMIVYNKDVKSKIDIATDIIKELESYIKIDYVLANSWYSSKSVIQTAINANYNYIGALRTNRVIYPNDKRKGIQIKEFAKHVQKKNFELVTVKGKKYYTYRYCGKINGFEKVLVIFSYPKDKFGDEKALKAFVSTITNKSTSEVLHIYCSR